MLCACDTQSSVASICSLAPASLKLAARQSSPPALNNPECSGPYEAPTRFSLFGVAVSTAALKIIGKRAAPPDFHFYVAHPFAAVSPHDGTLDTLVLPWANTEA